MIQNWLKDLQAVDSELAKAFSPVVLTMQSEKMDLSTLNNKLSNLSKVQGWLQETGKVHTLRNEVISLTSTPLNGEWIMESKNQSIHLNYLGDYVWLWQTYQISLSSENLTHLAEQVSQRVVGSQNESSLGYAKLWDMDENNTPVARLAVFTGFIE